MDEMALAKEHQEILDLAKSNKHRIDEMKEELKELRNLANAITQMVGEQKSMREDLTEVKSDVKQLKEKPAKRWDGAVDKICTLVIAAVVAYMLGQIGL